MNTATVQHFEKLDGMRGFGAIMVILGHSRFYIDNPTHFVNNGHPWVDMFFMMSGFVMAYVYQDNLGRGTNFRRYFIPRIGRLLPLHVAVLLAWIPYILFKGGGEIYGSADAAGFFRTLFLLNSIGLDEPTGWNGPSWSISAEVIAYLLFFGFCLGFSGLWKRAWIAGVIAVVAYAVLALLFPDDMLRTRDYGFLRGIAGFFVGVCLYLLHQSRRSSPPIPAGWPIWSLELILASSVIACLSLLGASAVDRLLTLSAMALFLIALTSQESGGLGRLLQSRVMKYLGEISYSMYMTHALVLSLTTPVLVMVLREPGSALPRAEIIRRGLEGNLALLVNTAIVLLVIGISAMTYRYIEVPFRAKAKRLARRV